jgi:deoxyribodipyrimidine photo-lyase
MPPAASRPAIVWFRDDLRLSDHPALHAARESGSPLICIYILDEESPGLRALGGASRWWLHQSLASLSASLEKAGARLDILQGAAQTLITSLAKTADAGAIYWTRRYGKAEIAVDREIKSSLSDAGLAVKSFNGQLLYEPWDVQTKSGDFFKVYSPFWRAALAKGEPEGPLARPSKLKSADWPTKGPKRLALDKLGLLPKKPDWAGGLRNMWSPGEKGAQDRLSAFLETRAKNYGSMRDRPDIPSTSYLSPHLRFGEISPRQVWHATRHAQAANKVPARDADKFLSEIGWREFAYHLLYHFPDLGTKNFQSKFDAFPWRDLATKELRDWQKGRTGYPIVDAGMRELWHTGTMHNRVRMIAASFLVKDLLGDWRLGEDWFWDTLCDACPANNTASWQWVAGSGADAAPYFRIFNPILQAQKFDPDATYVRKWVPEIAKLPDTWIHEPWNAPEAALKAAGIILGKTYPKPMVDHARARDRALAALASTKPDMA